MTSKVITALVAALLQMLSPEMLRRFIDAGLDAIEDYVAGTNNTIDDGIVIPACALLRKAVGIPDSDSPVEAE